MPRLRRVMSPGFPQHLTQRGNNRQACFFAESDYLIYLPWLQRAACAYSVSIHAYVLMPNHVHLILVPADADGLSAFAVVIMSGTTPQCSMAKFFPVRPIPVITSSAMKRMSCLSQISRIRG